MIAFLAWGKIALLAVFFFSIAIPATVAFFEDRQIKKLQEDVEKKYLEECNKLGRTPVKSVYTRK